MLAPLALILALLAVLALGVAASHVIGKVRAGGLFHDLSLLDLILLEIVHVCVFGIKLLLKFLDLLGVDGL